MGGNGIIAKAQAPEGLGRDVGALEGLIRHQPVPENDLMAQRDRLEAGTLAEKDAVLVGQAELLRSMLEGVPGMRCSPSDTRSKKRSRLSVTLRERQTFLL